MSELVRTTELQSQYVQSDAGEYGTSPRVVSECQQRCSLLLALMYRNFLFDNSISKPISCDKSLPPGGPRVLLQTRSVLLQTRSVHKSSEVRFRSAVNTSVTVLGGALPTAVCDRSKRFKAA